jgi:hypothetical protein
MKKKVKLLIEQIPDALEIPKWHMLDLDKRIKAYNENPDAGSSWSDVKKRILMKQWPVS